MLIPLTILLTILAFWGAGIYSPALFISSALLSSLAIYRSFGKKISNVYSILGISFMVLIIFTVITAIPLTSAVNGGLNSHRAEQNKIAATAIQESQDLGLTGHTSAAFSISRNRSGTIRTILLLISAGIFAALSSQMEEKSKLAFIRFTIALGTIIAIAGFIGQWVIPQGKSIWWTFKVNHGHPVACFVNRNHFGGYLAMISPAALVYTVSAWKQRNRIRALLYAAAFLAISFALISSLSRGAWVAWLSSLLLTSIILTKMTNSHRIITASVCVTAITAALVLGLRSSDDVGDRLASFENISQTESANMRFTTWKDSLKIIPDYPILGTGANGFRMLFPQYRTDSSRKEFNHVENDYIQIVLESGLLGSGLIISIIVLYFMRVYSSRDTSSTEQDIIAVCVIGAMTAVAIHALFDFSIRVPLTAITFAGLTGAWIKPLKRSRHTAGPCSSPIFLYGVSGLLLVIAIFLAGNTRMTERDSSDYIKEAGADELCRSLAFSPTSWQIWYHLGNQAIASALPGSYEFGEKCIRRAVEYNPLNYRLMKRLCLVRLHNNDIDGAKKAYRKLKELRSWVKIPELE